MEETRYKTIYVGFHDGQKIVETPLIKHEPVPLRLAVSHCQAAFIVNHLYAELKKMTRGLEPTDASQPSDAGTWP